MSHRKYSHCFTRNQLQLIIDDYLSLSPYFVACEKVLKEYIRKFQESGKLHSKEKPHPIKIQSREGEDGFKCTDNLKHSMLPCNKNSTYIYPLEILIDIFKSELFYKELPRQTIVNQLLTTTNISIIIETLTIVSQDMSKKIKVTIAKNFAKLETLYQMNIPSKTWNDQKQIKCAGLSDVTSQQNAIQLLNKNALKSKSTRRASAQKLIDVDKISESQILQSIINIELDDEIDQMEKGSSKDKMTCKTLKDSKYNFMTTNQDIMNETKCSYCRQYKLYLNESTNNALTDENLSRISKESLKSLKIISDATALFTLYLTEKNLIYIPNDINVINKVINTMGIIITSEIFCSSLNPKYVLMQSAKSTPRAKPPIGKNIFQDLTPYFHMYEYKNKMKDENTYSIEELFRMLINCPTLDQVKQELMAKYIDEDHLLRNTQQMKRSLSTEVGKSKSKQQQKQQQIMRVLEKEREKIAKNIVNTKPIYKQIDISEANKINTNISIVPTPIYNGFSANKTSISTANTSKGKRSIFSNKFSVTSQNDKQKKSGSAFQTQNSSVAKTVNSNQNPIEELQEIKEEEDSSKDIGDSKNVNNLKKPRLSKTAHKQQKHEVLARSSLFMTAMGFTNSNKSKPEINTNFMAMNSSIKKSIIKSPFSFAHNPTPNDQNQLRPISIQQNFGNQDNSEELSNQQFKRIMQTLAFKKSKNDQNGVISKKVLDFGLTTINYKASSYAKQSDKFQNLSVSKRFTNANESEDSGYQMEKESFNKLALNGLITKKEILKEIQNGKAILYEDYDSIEAMGRKDQQNENTHKKTKKCTVLFDISQNCQKQQRKVCLTSTEKSLKHINNFVMQNRVKFNESGLIRNQKYNKSIKNEMINHRYEYNLQQTMRNQRQQKLRKGILSQSKLTKTKSYLSRPKTAQSKQSKRQTNFISIEQYYQEMSSFRNRNQNTEIPFDQSLAHTIII